MRWRSPGRPSLSRSSSPGRPAEGGRAASVGSASLGGERGQRGYGNGSILAADSAGGKRIHLVGNRNLFFYLIPKFHVS